MGSKNIVQPNLYMGHLSFPILSAQRPPLSSGLNKNQASSAFYVKPQSSRRLLQWHCVRPAWA